ncbi:PTS system beta-glucoside-specific EIIBCA component [bioreactor metagenome]|uniref:PTS system beta-glucoside-specific EIIBCA component n=1 Tax=bioreactor metagenome TaxID=1076179 RepID=A0A645EVK7_9ZZZZ
MTMGFDTILVGAFAPSFAQTAVVAAMYFKLKDKKLKELCIPAVISGICGVTEPAIYGISLPKKKPFIFSCIGGALGGLVMGLMDAKLYIMGGLGIFGIPSYINPATSDAKGAIAAIICIGVAVVTGFVLTFFFWKDETEEDTTIVEPKKTIKSKIDIVYSPIKGEVKPLAQIKDDAFASGVLGKGVAIVPKEGKVVAPFDGTIMTLFPTKHAIGMVSDNGCEVLVHIGLDTVRLEGKYFETSFKVGDKVKKGQTLITFDKDEIIKEGYCLETPVIITNHSDYLEIIEVQRKTVNEKDELIKVIA